MTSGPTEHLIAQRAQEQKLLFLGLMLALPPLWHPDVPVLAWTLQLTGGAADDLPLVLSHGPDDAEKLTYSARDVLTKITKLHGAVLGEDAMSVGMLLGATRLGDMITAAGLSRRDVPLLQFARHFRNAAAHGDRWEFRGDEPRHPASCRDIVLSKDLHGRRATWETVSPRRYVEYLDDISNYFVPGSVPPPAGP